MASAATGLLLGMFGVAYIVKELAVEFEERKDHIHKSLLAFSTMFVIGMEYAAVGIAKSNNYINAKNAYIFALLVTSLVFLGMTYRIIMQMKEEVQNSDSSMRGLGE